MTDVGFPLAQFTISDAVKREIENMRQFWNSRLDDPADTVLIGWSEVRPHTGSAYECVMVSFYGRSQRSEIAHGIQNVSGLPIVFFATAKHAPIFDGKVVDFTPERGFFLRDP